MPRKPARAVKSRPLRLQLVVPGKVGILMDEHAAKMSEKFPGVAATRNDVLRRALYTFLKAPR